MRRLVCSYLYERTCMCESSYSIFLFSHKNVYENTLTTFFSFLFRQYFCEENYFCCFWSCPCPCPGWCSVNFTIQYLSFIFFSGKIQIKNKHQKKIIYREKTQKGKYERFKEHTHIRSHINNLAYIHNINLHSEGRHSEITFVCIRVCECLILLKTTTSTKCNRINTRNFFCAVFIFFIFFVLSLLSSWAKHSFVHEEHHSFCNNILETLLLRQHFVVSSKVSLWVRESKCGGFSSYICHSICWDPQPVWDPSFSYLFKWMWVCVGVWHMTVFIYVAIVAVLWIFQWCVIVLLQTPPNSVARFN